MIEVEQKFSVADVQPLRKQLLALGAREGEPIEQVDVYFSHPARDFAETDEALRIRRIGRQNFVTYKGPKLDKTTKTRREIELTIPPGDRGAADFTTLLKVLGFERAGEVRKTRTSFRLNWQGQDATICCDQVHKLGRYVELEITSREQGLQVAKEALTSLSELLGLAGGERRSYLELLLAKQTAAPQTAQDA